MTSRDGLFCLECEGGAIFDPTSMECTGCSASTEIYGKHIYTISSGAVYIIIYGGGEFLSLQKFFFLQCWYFQQIAVLSCDVS